MPVNRGILESTTDDYTFDDHVTFQPNGGEVLQKGNDSNGQGRKKLSSRIHFLVVGFILLVVVVIIVLAVTLNKTESLSETGKISDDRRLKLDEVLLQTYQPPSFGLFWISDNTYLEFQDGVKIGYIGKDDKKTILTDKELRESRTIASTIMLSPDNKWLLFANNTEKLYRHSFYADYYVKNLETNTIVQIKPDSDQKEQLRYCSWANNGSAVVFIYNCNVYYVPDAGEPSMRYYQLTTDGIPKQIFNGIPDWVYEEEILQSGKAFEVSSDGKYLAYVTFNATQTSYFSYSIYNQPSNRYPYIDTISYPKAGYPNPKIKFSIVSLELVKEEKSTLKNFTKHTTTLSPPSSISKSDYYYCIMSWSPGNELYVQWMNRGQNESVSMTYAASTGISTTVQAYNTPGGWIESNYFTPKFAKDNSHYITMLPKDDFRHLAKVTMNPKGKPEVEYLTAGDYVVQDVNCYNADQEILYYRSTETSPHQRHVYKINTRTKEKSCLTCGLLKDTDGTACTYHTIVFSTKCSYATIRCNGPYPPVTYMMYMNTMKVFNVTSNERVKKLLKRRDLPTSRIYAVKSDGFHIKVKETRPAGFDPKKKYPVLLSVYGGPGTQKVNEKYSISFDHYIVSSNDIILINFDARGAGYYGFKFMYAVYKNLGHYEAVDAINVAKYMQQQPYVDADKIAIWGWSYGGFYSSMVLGMPSNVIKTAVAVAPVTDWRYYDTIYTERYMGIPSKEDNLEGYINTSVLFKAENFRGKNFLLVHGTADDNVHFQNAAQLAKSLVKSKVKFRAQFYTDGRHSIRSGAHVHYLIADYLFAHLRNTHIPANSTFGLGGTMK